eukprot:COSAG05_NODE_3069_length_2359_cov_2.105310_2_plen_86_part_00
MYCMANRSHFQMLSSWQKDGLDNHVFKIERVKIMTLYIVAVYIPIQKENEKKQQQKQKEKEESGGVVQRVVKCKGEVRLSKGPTT